MNEEINKPGGVNLSSNGGRTPKTGRKSMTQTRLTQRNYGN